MTDLLGAGWLHIPQNAVWESYAPGRAEFLGNHTDYNDGFVLGLGLGVGVTASARDGRLADVPLQRARHVVSENVRVVAAVQALERGDLAAVGRLMNESHESSRLLFENSCEEVDFLAVTARQFPGFYGARLSGGGFGGAILAMVEAERTDLFVEVFAREVRAAWGREPELLVTGADGPVD